MLENLCSILIQKVLNQPVKHQNNKLKSKNQNSKLKRRNLKKKLQNQKKESNQKHQSQLKLNQLKNQNQLHMSQKSTSVLKEKKPENPCPDSDKELPKDLNNHKIIMLFLLPSKKSICSLPQNAEKYFFILFQELGEDFLKKYGVKLGFMSFFVRAATMALQEFPVVNSVIDGNEIVRRNFIDMSVAVATPTGLLVPVLRNCQNMKFHDIELVKIFFYSGNC